MKDLWLKITSVRLTTWMQIAGVIILLTIAVGRCNNLPSNKADKKKVDSVYNSYQEVARIKQVENDSLRRELVATKTERIAADHRADSLEKELTASIAEIRQSAGEIKKNLAAGDQARAAGDTQRIVSNCDSLRQQVRSVMILAENYARIKDSAVSAHIAVMQIRDRHDTTMERLIANQDFQLKKADTTIAVYKNKYDILDKNYSKANSRLNFNKTLSRGLAIGLLAAGLKIFIFK